MKDIDITIGNVRLRRLDVTGDVMIYCITDSGGVCETGVIKQITLAPLAAILESFSKMSYVEAPEFSHSHNVTAPHNMDDLLGDIRNRPTEPPEAPEKKA